VLFVVVHCDSSAAKNVGPKRKLLLDMRGVQLMPVAAALGEEERTEGFPLLQQLACVSSRLLEGEEGFY
jgi:hypothetical protein